MIVTPIKDRANPERSYVRLHDVPAHFPNDRGTPNSDEDVEVMITGVHYHTDEDGNYDKTRPKRLFIRVVTDRYVPVEHNGFQLEDDKLIASGNYKGLPLRLHAGRTGAAISYKPGVAYVRMQDLNRTTVRIEGLRQLSDLECFRNLVD